MKGLLKRVSSKSDRSSADKANKAQQRGAEEAAKSPESSPSKASASASFSDPKTPNSGSEKQQISVQKSSEQETVAQAEGAARTNQDELASPSSSSVQSGDQTSPGDKKAEKLRKKLEETTKSVAEAPVIILGDANTATQPAEKGVILLGDGQIVDPAAAEASSIAKADTKPVEHSKKEAPSPCSEFVCCM